MWARGGLVGPAHIAGSACIECSMHRWHASINTGTMPVWARGSQDSQEVLYPTGSWLYTPCTGSFGPPTSFE
jgi:nitrite reductase/ring-hydroxylating ferredoxin subunit